MITIRSGGGFGPSFFLASASRASIFRIELAKFPTKRNRTRQSVRTVHRRRKSKNKSHMQ